MNQTVHTTMIFLIIIAVCASCEALYVHYRPCTYKGHGPTSEIMSINIDPLPAGGCEHLIPGTTATLCQIQSGKLYNVTINFIAEQTSRTATSKAYSHLGLAGTIEVYVDPLDACSNGVKCPIVAGTNVTYRASIQVPVHDLGIKGVGEWQVLGDNDKAIVCFIVPLFIDSSIKT